MSKKLTNENQIIQTKCDVGRLLPGESYLSRVSYMKVNSVDFSGVNVVNEAGMSWGIGKEIVARECYAADQFNETKQVTRTELINIFCSVGDTIYTVNFNKQPKIEDAYDAVANNGRIKSNSDIKKALKEKMAGEERTLVGYTLKLDAAYGRSMVVDLQQEDKSDRVRQVDHRTLNWLIFKNVKYVVKN